MPSILFHAYCVASRAVIGFTPGSDHKSCNVSGMSSLYFSCKISTVFLISSARCWIKNSLKNCHSLQKVKNIELFSFKRQPFALYSEYTKPNCLSKHFDSDVVQTNPVVPKRKQTLWNTIRCRCPKLFYVATEFA